MLYRDSLRGPFLTGGARNMFLECVLGGWWLLLFGWWCGSFVGDS